MRDIKFRAWDSHDKIMMWCPSGPIGEYIFTRSAGSNAIETIPFKVIYYQLTWPQPKAGLGTYKTDRYMLMQHTGLKDKNDVEIYEGDIVRDITDHDNGFKSTYLNNVYAVEWDSEYGHWQLKDGFEALGSAINDQDQSIEVIGNVYENPELLKGDK